MSNTVFFFFSSKFSRIFNALSDSKRLSIFAIDSMDKSINISVWIDSFNSIKISESRLKPSNSISFDLFSGTKFSIISAVSDGCSSFRVLFRKFVSFYLIFLLNRLINSLLNSKFTFLSAIFFVKLIKVLCSLNFATGLVDFF